MGFIGYHMVTSPHHDHQKQEWASYYLTHLDFLDYSIVHNFHCPHLVLYAAKNMQGLLLATIWELAFLKFMIRSGKWWDLSGNICHMNEKKIRRWHVCEYLGSHCTHTVSVCHKSFLTCLKYVFKKACMEPRFISLFNLRVSFFPSLQPSFPLLLFLWKYSQHRVKMI